MKKVRVYLLMYLLLGMAPFLSAQKPYADSLKKVLFVTRDARHRIDLKCEIAYDLYDFADSIAFNYAREAKEEAEKENYNSGIKRALTLMGLGYYNEARFETALGFFKRSEKMKAEMPSGLEGYNLMLIGSVYRDLAMYDSAKHFYDKALKAIGPDGDSYYQAFSYRSLAYIGLIRWNNADALFYLKKAENLALLKPRDYFVVLNIWSLFFRYYLNTNDFEKAQYYLDKLCSKSENVKDYFNRISCLSGQVEMDIRKGQYKTALQKTFEALKMADIFKHPQQRIMVYWQIGTIYTEMSEFTLASQYYFEGLKISERIGMKYETAMLLGGLAWVFKEQLNFPLALEYLAKSEAIRSSIGDKNGLSQCKNIRGLVYFLQKKYNLSLAEYEQALELRQSSGNKVGVAAVLYNMSLVYQANKQLDRAYQLQVESMHMEEESKNKQGITISYTSMAELLIKMNRLNEAETYLEKALSFVKTTQSKVIKRNVYRNYSQLNEARGNLKEALRYERKYIELNDSIYSEAGSLKLAEMETLYQLEQKEQKIKEIDAIKQLRERELATQKELGQRQQVIITVSAFAIVLLVLAGLVGYQYYRAKSEVNKKLKVLNRDILEQKEEIQAQSEELQAASNTISTINKQLELKIEERTYELKQAYKELDTFFYRSSHDFRRPITTFLGLAGVAAVTVKDPVSLELFDKVRETASNLDKMLQKLQSISDLGAQQMIFKEVFLKELVDDVLDGFRPALQAKNIMVTTEMIGKSVFSSYPVLVKLILENLVENSIHFAGTDSPFIKIKIKVNEEQLEMMVEDNGQGIMAEYQPRIFEMYFRANDRSKGNGLGLYISKKAVERLNGWIGFSSEYLKGSVFIVRIPNVPTPS